MTTVIEKLSPSEGRKMVLVGCAIFWIAVGICVYKFVL